MSEPASEQTLITYSLILSEALAHYLLHYHQLLVSLTKRLMKNGGMWRPPKPPAILPVRPAFVCVLACMFVCMPASRQVAATDAGVPAIS